MSETDSGSNVVRMVPTAPRHRPSDIREIDALLARSGDFDEEVRGWVADRPLTSPELQRAAEWLRFAMPEDVPSRSRVCRDYAAQAERQAASFSTCARALLALDPARLADVPTFCGSGIPETRELLNLHDALVGVAGVARADESAVVRRSVIEGVEELASRFLVASGAMRQWADHLSNLRAQRDGERLFDRLLELELPR